MENPGGKRNWEAEASIGITKTGIAEMVWEDVDGDRLVQSRGK